MDVKRRTIRSLVSKLSSLSEQTRSEVLSELRLISKHDAESRPIIADAGAVPFLAKTLLSASHSAQDDAAAAATNLSISYRHSLVSMHGLLDALSHALRHHHSSSSPATELHNLLAAAALDSLLAAAVEDYRPIVGSKSDVIYSLVDILKTPTSRSRSVKDALKVLFSVALYPLNPAAMVELGVVPAFFALIVKNSSVGIVEDVVVVLAQVADCEESEDTFCRIFGIGVLADLLDLATGATV